MNDPLDDPVSEPPSLREQVEPYLKYGDAELAVSLLNFQKRFGGPGIARPALRGADYHCPECEVNVRGVSRSAETLLSCPICGTQPGMLTLGSGPK